MFFWDCMVYIQPKLTDICLVSNGQNAAVVLLGLICSTCILGPGLDILYQSALFVVRMGKSRFIPGVYIKLLPTMNDKHAKLSFFNLPSLEKIPDINHSLKLINTINVFPQHSSFENVQIPHSSHLQPQDSLAQRISHVNTAAQSAKKRKIGCTCKKTFCLKMYCQCFSQGKQCGEDCACTNCKNAPGFEQTIINAKMGIKEGGTRNCALSQKRCNCKKSHCLKRYCECFNAGVGCSQDCKCQSCQNKVVNQQQVGHIQAEIQQQVNSSINEQKGVLPSCQFPSINVYRSMDDLSKFYN